MNTERKNVEPDEPTTMTSQTGADRANAQPLPKDYDADDMRGAEIVLKRKSQRRAIIGVAVAGVIALAVVSGMAAG